MSIDAAQLAAQREAMQGKEPESKTADGKRVEKIFKMFTDIDKIAAIKANPAQLTLGHGENRMTVLIQPMNPKQFALSYLLIRSLLLPIISIVRTRQAGKNINLVEIFDAFGENIERLPELLFIIISRGNPQITQEWVDNHFDLVFDLFAVLEPFVQQNGLDTLFFPNAGGANRSESAQASAETTTPPTAE